MTPPATHAALQSSPATPGTALEQAVGLVAGELSEVDARLEQLLQSSIAIIPELGGKLAFAGGKRFRPLVTLLAARAAGFIDPVRITIAAVGELLHTATLLHDDVIDAGEFRRGRPTARLQYGNGMAVLTGDFCLARAMQAIAYSGRLHAVQTLSDAVTRMAEGEVAQLEIAGDAAPDKARYYLVIERKTAALIAWCASVGGLPAPERAIALHRYGLEIGYAFQIADDVLDYAGDPHDTGKTRGQDLRDGKLTLPLILACERDPGLQRAVHQLLAHGPPVGAEAAEAIVARVAASPGVELAARAAESHAEAAVAQLAELPSSSARDALIELARSVSRRVS
ncbi:octaprenyl-diphosphate synthase [Nannocystis exedens]|uniref:Octaprenyl-diphosphate synthase n=1 Tax=Nannocystis exedens TaxID=54 RepID=A0A1I1T3S8_9BACT|nr:polyprenyl synthetase family protein [Nannocystis exedens]PCC66799.1 geranylgeranyl pyrophosphate synthase [Nannocystis exedens]SFD53314.1 octaprenyl-diphosphate synthase [Nannocystis exedens]